MSVLDNGRKEIEDKIRKINELWIKGELKELEKHFHSDMIIQGPGLQVSIKGNRNCIKHHEDFLTHTKVKSFKDSEYVVNVWGNTAVASYKFDIEFESDEETRKESGNELYAFLQEDSIWKVVWNTIISSTGRNA